MIEKVKYNPVLEGAIYMAVLKWSEFRGDILVKGYRKYPIQADEVCALLQYPSFIIPAKAVKHIGADKLQRMLVEAEAAYNLGQQ